MLTKQGHPGREMFVLLEGTVDVVRDGALVNRLGPGDFVGEGALMLSKPRNATITATSPIRALVITQSNFTHLLDEDPDIARSVQRDARRANAAGGRLDSQRANAPPRPPSRRASPSCRSSPAARRRELRKIAAIADELDLRAGEGADAAGRLRARVLRAARGHGRRRARREAHSRRSAPATSSASSRCSRTAAKRDGHDHVARPGARSSTATNFKRLLRENPSDLREGARGGRRADAAGRRRLAQ